MKNFNNKILNALLIFITVFSLFSNVAIADVTSNLWYKDAINSISTNTGNGLANADIHVGGCYIGPGTGTPCGGGGGGAWSSITGTPTEVAYFDGSGNGTSDANFTTTSTLFNLTRTPSAGYAGNVFITDNTLGAGIPGMGFYAQTANGINGVFVVDASSLGGTLDQSFYGFSNLLGGPTAEMQSRYDAGIDEANLDFNVENSLGNQVRIRMNSRTTGTSAGVSIYGVNASGSNSVFSVRNSSSARLLYLDNDGNLQINNSYYLPNTQGTSGQVLTANGSGGTSWTNSSAFLNHNYIGVGNTSGTLDGYSSFTYNQSNYLFEQTIPTSTNNGNPVGSPLVFNSPDWNGVGNNNITISWDASTYKSNKYGGTLSISIPVNLQADWVYTGQYGETINSGTFAYTPGVPNTIQDLYGNDIATITFSGPNVGGELWTAGASFPALATWGMSFEDSLSSTFLDVRPIYGKYVLGDKPSGNILVGNGTRIEISDNTAELELFSKRYFRVLTPNGAIIALADMVNNVWSNYRTFEVLNNIGDKYFEVKAQSGTVTLGPDGGTTNSTHIKIDDITQLITVTNVPTYADDTAATSAGLTTGQLYKTTTGGITSLNIVP